MILPATLRLVFAQAAAEMLLSLTMTALTYAAGLIQNKFDGFIKSERKSWTEQSTGGEWVPWQNTVSQHNYGRTSYRTAPRHRPQPQISRRDVVNVSTGEITRKSGLYSTSSSTPDIVEEKDRGVQLGDPSLDYTEEEKIEAVAQIVAEQEEFVPDADLTEEEIQAIFESVEQMPPPEPLTPKPSDLTLTLTTAELEAINDSPTSDCVITPSLYRERGFLFKARKYDDIGPEITTDSIVDEIREIMAGYYEGIQHQKQAGDSAEITDPMMQQYNLLGWKIGEPILGF